MINKLLDYDKSIYGTTVGPVLRTWVQEIQIPEEKPKHCFLPDIYLVGLMVSYFRPKVLLEVGTYYGFSSVILSKIASLLDFPLHIITVEKNIDYYNKAKERFKTLGLNNIESICDDANNLRNIFKNRFDIDMVFLDGDPASPELDISIEYCDTIVGHDMFYKGTNYLAPRGFSFQKASLKSGYQQVIININACGVGLLYK